MHPTGGSRRVFQQFSWLEVGSGKVTLSHPTHQRVTRAVRRVQESIKMKKNSVTDSGLKEEEAQALVMDLATSFVKDGYLSTTGKTKEQFVAEFMEFAKNTEIILRTDYTESLLRQARSYRRERSRELACLFYATWIEHTLNGFISSLARRMDFADNEITDIIRETSYKAKMSWMLRLFGRDSFNNSHINLIVKLMEVRNAFVHYKWKPESNQVRKETEALLSRIERTVKYIQEYERRNLLEVSRSKVKNLIKHA